MRYPKLLGHSRSAATPVGGRLQPPVLPTNADGVCQKPVYSSCSIQRKHQRYKNATQKTYRSRHLLHNGLTLLQEEDITEL